MSQLNNSYWIEINKILWPLIWIGIIVLIAYFKRKKTVGKRWTAPVSAQLTIHQIPLICRHCQGDLFYKREAIFATTLVAVFFNIFWNKSGVVYECKKCGYIHWFYKPQETVIAFHHDIEK